MHTPLDVLHHGIFWTLISGTKERDQCDLSCFRLRRVFMSIRTRARGKCRFFSLVIEHFTSTFMIAYRRKQDSGPGLKITSRISLYSTIKLLTPSLANVLDKREIRTIRNTNDNDMRNIELQI